MTMASWPDEFVKDVRSAIMLLCQNFTDDEISKMVAQKRQALTAAKVAPRTPRVPLMKQR